MEIRNGCDPVSVGGVILFHRRIRTKLGLLSRPEKFQGVEKHARSIVDHQEGVLHSLNVSGAECMRGLHVV